MKNVSLILVFLMISGCTYDFTIKEAVTPVTYNSTIERASNSIGRLRRLALMPITLETYEGRYSSKKDYEDSVQYYTRECARYLHIDKGYSVIVVSEPDGTWKRSMFIYRESHKVTEWSHQWSQELEESHSASIVNEIGLALHADGLLVVKIAERKPWSAAGGLLNIALLNIPLFYNIARPDMGAWIYETSSGKLVWSEEHSTFSDGENRPFYINDLFRDLDNAVPIQLTK